MANYKGSSIVLLRKRISTESEVIQKALLDSMSLAEKTIFESCLSSTWIPLPIAQNILEKVAQSLYPEKADAIRLLGAERARIHLTGIYRAILRISKPSFIIGQSSKIWSTYLDKGTASHQLIPGKNAAIMIVEGFPDLPLTFREISSGYICAAVEMTGAKNVQLQRDDSNPNAWRWTGTWE